MEDTFVLKIMLGVDAMQTGGDVADALRATADKIDTRRGAPFAEFDHRYGYVVDSSGNSVGEWEIQ